MTTYTTFEMFGEPRLIPIEAVKTYARKTKAVADVRALKVDELGCVEKVSACMSAIQSCNRRVEREGWYSYDNSPRTREHLASLGHAIV